MYIVMCRLSSGKWYQLHFADTDMVCTRVLINVTALLTCEALSWGI